VGYIVHLGLLLGYVVSSGTKSDVTFLLPDPDFLIRQQNFVHISCSFRDPHFGLLRGLGLLLGYLTRSSVKSGIIFFLGDPGFL